MSKTALIPVSSPIPALTDHQFGVLLYRCRKVFRETNLTDEQRLAWEQAADADYRRQLREQIDIEAVKDGSARKN